MKLWPRSTTTAGVMLWLTVGALGGTFPHCVPYRSADYDSVVQRLIDSTFAEKDRANTERKKGYALWSSKELKIVECAKYDAFPELLLFYWSSLGSARIQPSPMMINTRLNKGYLFVGPLEPDTWEIVDTFDVSFQRMVHDLGRTFRDEDSIWQLISLYFSCRKVSCSLKMVYRQPDDINRLIAFPWISEKDFKRIFGFPYQDSPAYSICGPFLIYDFSRVPTFKSEWPLPPHYDSLSMKQWPPEFDFNTLIPPRMTIQNDTVRLTFDLIYETEPPIASITLIRRNVFIFATDLSFFQRGETPLFESN